MTLLFRIEPNLLQIDYLHRQIYSKLKVDSEQTAPPTPLGANPNNFYSVIKLSSKLQTEENAE